MLCNLRDRDNLGTLLVDREIPHAVRIADTSISWNSAAASSRGRHPNSATTPRR
jgi:hypothetical protein